MFVLTRPARTSRFVQEAPQFSRAFDQFFDEPLSRLLGGSSSDAAPARVPSLDVTESDTAYTVAFDVPGVTRDQLKVTVEGRRVSIETVEPAKVEAVEASTEDAAKDAPVVAAPRVLYRERSSARYARTVALPAEVDQTASQAKFENGVLTLTLAKKVKTGATQLSIS